MNPEYPSATNEDNETDSFFRGVEGSLIVAYTVPKEKEVCMKTTFILAQNV